MEFTQQPNTPLEQRVCNIAVETTTQLQRQTAEYWWDTYQVGIPSKAHAARLAEIAAEHPHWVDGHVLAHLGLEIF